MASGNSSKSRKKRKIDVLVLSDVHLGTYGSKAKELIKYLRSIQPKRVILNGDIIDIWQFSKNYWPKSHMKVLNHLMKWISAGVETTYITGNHDEMLRKFEGFKVGNFDIQNKLILEVKSKKAWIFHGDVFDVTMKHSRWLAKLGAYGYGSLILLNRSVNFFTKLFGKGRISLSKSIKDGVKGSSKSLIEFEATATSIAAENEYDYVLCGHIHKPKIQEYLIGDRKVVYLNSGDWVENMTALEFKKGKWKLYSYKEDEFLDVEDEEDIIELENNLTDKSAKELFSKMFNEILNRN